MKRLCVKVTGVVLALALAGCNTTTGSGVSDSSAADLASSSSYSGSSTSGAGSATNFASLPLDSLSGSGTAQTGSKTIYFDFDSYQIKSEFQPVVAAHAAYLAANPAAKVRLEGHADERGTREYNMALGERRANAVASLFVAAGASSSQINSVSYGEEQPMANCHDESCWSQNRRALIQYEAK